MRRTWCLSLYAVAATAVGVPALQAAVTPPAGYIYDTLQLGTVTQSCIASGPGGTFVGVGKSFTANAGAIVLVPESGDARLVAFGFNSIADCAYDAGADVLYVSDNADNADLGITTSFAGNTGAQTGDTVFAIPSASTASALAATDLALLPPNSFEFAANLAVDVSGNVFIGNAAGGGAGTVSKIAPGPSATVFRNNLQFTGGLAIDADGGDVFVAESLPSFENQLHQFTAGGAVVASPLLGPSFGFGSSDLVFTNDGTLLVTGLFSGPVVAVNVGGPSTSTFISGLTFASGITVNAFTGRIELLSSTFSGAAEDKSIHRFIPVDQLEPGKLEGATECLHEFYGIELVAAAPGEDAKKAICVDGAACDADGEVNDRCLFPVGSCFNVTDARLPECTPNANITAVETSAGRDVRAFDDLDATITAQLPIVGPSCVFSDGVLVKVAIKPTGARKEGKGKIAVSVENALGKKDKDVIGLVCQPAL